MLFASREILYVWSQSKTLQKFLDHDIFFRSIIFRSRCELVVRQVSSIECYLIIKTEIVFHRLNSSTTQLHLGVVDGSPILPVWSYRLGQEKVPHRPRQMMTTTSRKTMTLATNSFFHSHSYTLHGQIKMRTLINALRKKDLVKGSRQRHKNV